MIPVVIAGVNVVVPLFKVERVCGRHHVFHDETFEQPLIFNTMRDSLSYNNVCTERSCRPGAQFNNVRKSERSFAYTCQMLEGLRCEHITLNFFPSQQTSRAQFLPCTRKEPSLTKGKVSAATTIAKRLCPLQGGVANTLCPSDVSVTTSPSEAVNSCRHKIDHL